MILKWADGLLYYNLLDAVSNWIHFKQIIFHLKAKLQKTCSGLSVPFVLFTWTFAIRWHPWTFTWLTQNSSTYYKSNSLTSCLSLTRCNCFQVNINCQAIRTPFNAYWPLWDIWLAELIVTHTLTGADTKVSDVDGMAYSTLLYGTGPGYSRPRLVPSNHTSDTEERNVVHGSAVPRQWATHGGEDVPIFAQVK